MAAKQMDIEGIGRVEIKEIDEAASAYVAVRDRRMAATEKEVAAKTNLIEVVLAHEKELSKDGDGNRVYRFDDELVILTQGKVKIKVKHANDDSEEEDD